MSRQAHCQQQVRDGVQHRQHARILERVSHLRLHQPRLGTRKLHHLLHQVPPALPAPHAVAARPIGRDALFTLLREARLLVPPLRAYHKTTNSHHHLRRHPNLLKGDDRIQPTGSEQLWVADITYLPTQAQCVYLSLVTDAYSRKIVGYHVHDTLQAAPVSQALKMALRTRQTRQTRQPLIHHSDRGIQYCSAGYQQIHQNNGITCSMTDGYDCYQNALAERVNGILKGEFLLHRPTNLAQATQMVKQSIRIYNNERPHLSLKYKTPDEVHRASLNTISSRPANHLPQCVNAG